MSNHSTYESAVISAGPTQLASVTAAIATHQTTTDAVNSVVGYNNINGNNALLTSTTKTAALAKLESLNTAEKVKQAAIAAAREALRTDNTGDGTKF